MNLEKAIRLYFVLSIANKDLSEDDKDILKYLFDGMAEKGSEKGFEALVSYYEGVINSNKDKNEGDYEKVLYKEIAKIMAMNISHNYNLTTEIFINNLYAIAYNDKECCKAEKYVIDEISNEFNIEKKSLAELEACHKTIVNLETEKKKIIDTNLNYNYIDKILKSIDLQIENIQDYIINQVEDVVYQYNYEKYMPGKDVFDIVDESIKPIMEDINESLQPHVDKAKEVAADLREIGGKALGDAAKSFKKLTNTKTNKESEGDK